MFKQKRISLDEGLALFTQYQQIPITLVAINLQDAIRIASAQNIYAYDGYLIQCSLEVGHPILSLDRGLQRAARNVGAQVLEVS